MEIIDKGKKRRWKRRKRKKMRTRTEE